VTVAASNDRIGILGGTFDPIHNGHLEAAHAARHAVTLDRIMLLPARTPPHRSAEPRASAFHRFAMAALAATTKPGMEVSDLELHREGPSYTSMTLERLHADGYKPSQLFFILGADAFAEIGTWHDYPRLFDLGNFVVVSRPGFATANLTSGPGIFFVAAETPDVSSTEIRRRVGANESIEGMVPPIVADHIRRHRLYVPAPVTAVL
jgi:nicotinate-nucleotide adenylyltransferase